MLAQLKITPQICTPKQKLHLTNTNANQIRKLTQNKPKSKQTKKQIKHQ